MLGLGWIIALGTWAAYSLAMVFLVRVVVKSSLKYLNHPPVNFMRTCRAAARYDFTNINIKQMTFGAVFILPIRLVILLTFVILTTLMVLVFKWSFCGSIRSYFSYHEK